MSGETDIKAGLSIEMGSGRQPLGISNPSHGAEKNIWLVVRNGGKPVGNCSVIVESFEYYFRDDWITAPNGCEQKALTWRQIKKPTGSGVDISTNGSRQIEIVSARRMPNPHFVIAYADRVSGKTHHFLGKYKLRVKIEAETVRNERVGELQAVFYDVFFDYEGTLKINVKEILKIALSDSA